MITDDALKQHVYRAILKMANKRLEQAIPGSLEGASRQTMREPAAKFNVAKIKTQDLRGGEHSRYGLAN